MLADVLTMREHSDKPLDEIAYCYLGDARNNVARLPPGHRRAARHGRAASCAPARALARRRPRAPRPARSPRRPAPGSLVTDDVADGVRGVDFLYTDVWVSMGEPAETWDARIEALLPVPGQRRGASRRPGNPRRQLHALPAGLARPRDRRRPSSSHARSASTRSRSPTTCSSRRLDRVRPGREPDAHHQGGDGRDARSLTVGAHRAPAGGHTGP